MNIPMVNEAAVYMDGEGKKMAQIKNKVAKIEKNENAVIYGYNSIREKRRAAI